VLNLTDDYSTIFAADLVLKHFMTIVVNGFGQETLDISGGGVYAHSEHKTVENFAHSGLRPDLPAEEKGR